MNKIISHSIEVKICARVKDAISWLFFKAWNSKPGFDIIEQYTACGDTIEQYTASVSTLTDFSHITIYTSVQYCKL